MPRSRVAENSTSRAHARVSDGSAGPLGGFVHGCEVTSKFVTPNSRVGGAKKGVLTPTGASGADETAGCRKIGRKPPTPPLSVATAASGLRGESGHGATGERLGCEGRRA